MNPQTEIDLLRSQLDRIEQLNQEVAELKEAHAAANRLLQLEKDTNALLRSQLADARKQLEADSQTIANLAKDKRELFAESAELLNAITLWLEADMRQAPPNAESMAAFFLPTFCKNAHNFLSRHA